MCKSRVNVRKGDVAQESDVECKYLKGRGPVKGMKIYYASDRRAFERQHHA